MDKAKKLAEEMRGSNRVSDSDIEQAFSQLWNDWVAELSSGEKQTRRPWSCLDTVCAILYEKYRTEKNTWERIEELQEWESFQFNEGTHINQVLKGLEFSLQIDKHVFYFFLSYTYLPLVLTIR